MFNKEQLAEREHSLFRVIPDYDPGRLFIVQEGDSAAYMVSNRDKIFINNEPIKNIEVLISLKDDTQSDENNPLKQMQFRFSIEFPNIPDMDTKEAFKKDFDSMNLGVGVGLEHYDDFSRLYILFPQEGANVDKEQFLEQHRQAMNVLEKTIRYVFSKKNITPPNRSLKLDLRYKWGDLYWKIRRNSGYLPVKATHEDITKYLASCPSCSQNYYINESPVCPQCGDSHPRLLRN